MKKTIFAMIFLLLFGLSITYAQQVYIAGSDGSGLWEDDPVYWINGNQTVLPKTGEDASALGIAVSGSDVFITGRDDRKAVYWLNGTEAGLSKGLGDATGIAVSGQNFHIVGSDDDVPGEWIYPHLVYARLSLSKISKESYAYAIAISGSKRYIAGIDGDDAVYWVKDNRNSKETVLPKKSKSAYAVAIAVSGSKIYIAGFDGQLNGEADAVYWLNGKQTVLPKTYNFARAT